MHLLDFILYWVFLFLIYKGMYKFSGGAIVYDQGAAMVFVVIFLAYTVIYLNLFVLDDTNWQNLNWIDIFTGNVHFPHLNITW